MKNNTRRRLLQTTLIAGSAALPDKWVKPVVNSVILPAHAQTSATTPAPTTPTPGNFQIIACSIETAPPVDNETINDTGSGCGEFSSADLIARSAGVEDIPSGQGGILRLETIKNETTSDQTTDITKVVVDGRSICVNGTLSSGQIPSLLQQVGLNPNRSLSGPSNSQVNQGEDRIININRGVTQEANSVFIGDPDNACLAVVVLSGRLNVTFTINTTTTRKLLNISTFMVA